MSHVYIFMTYAVKQSLQHLYVPDDGRVQPKRVVKRCTRPE
jgi:hypothetical protein